MADFEFRRLKSEDVFPMFQILSKIGFREIKDSISPEMVGKIKQAAKKDEDGNVNREELVYSVGISIVMDFADMVIGKIPSCKKEIYTLLSNVSGMSVKEIADLDFVVFTEMIIAFVKKDEFKDFVKVVSKLFN